MPETKHIPVDLFGKNHWSTFAYIETRCVDYGGVLDKRHMRCDETRHPGHAVNRWAVGTGKKYPTILKGNVERADHDDWDCADDLEAAGLLKVAGTGMNPVYSLTDAGNRMASDLRAHKANGGNFAGFSPRALETAHA